MPSLQLRPQARGALSRLLAGCAVLALSGCAQLDAAAEPPHPQAGRTPVEAVTVAPSPTAATTPAPAPIAANVAVTPAGVPVAVVDRTAGGVVVRSPCGNDVEVAQVEPIPAVTVVLDPGHGGPKDEGARGPNGLLERDLNLQVAEATKLALESRGIATALTRTGDYAVPLAVRAAFADAAEAAALVSIHHNSPASAPSAVPGTEVFVQTGSAASARLGGLLYEETTTALAAFDIAWTRAHDAGVLTVQLPDGTDAYGMIRRPAVPTALVELGYLANPAEAALFATEAYVTAASESIAAAVQAYLEEPDRQGTGHVAAPRVFTPGRATGGVDCVDPPLG